MTDTTMPPHPGLEKLTNIDELKHLCPAFSKGCPYAALEEVDSLAVSHGELSRCPAFKDGCPFSTKSEQEIMDLMAQIPKDHPTLNMSELPSCEEGVVLVEMLNRFLDKSQLETLFDIKQEEEAQAEPEPEYLEDPQLASAMREGTKVVHRAAETSVFTRRFLKGDINANEYGRYINSLYFVYKYMEELLEQYKQHPVVKIIHFPFELNRKESLEQDLAYFYGLDRVEELTQPNTMTPAVKKYVQSMKDACAKNPALLIAHSYSRYLGDLSGGQILAKRLKKHVFGLDENDSSWDTIEGLRFYHFENLGNQADFKNFYRERLNAAKVDQQTRDLIVAEAVQSFELNIDLFDEVQALSEADMLVPTVIQQEEEELVDLKEEVIEVETTTTYTDRAIESIDHHHEPKKTHWLRILTMSMAALAVSVAVYNRYKK
ncbi:heme oxygenase-domain-containing protein [Gilbertella persicaria]|uniref:heme oxygenase-domain-containing protein n=1 Tax=Gilbertella persicaria TaxID=101096 RepID=UPI00221F6D94|nr:heme oxygenase-domain-containing protein [Gilbertella persicaria]KAI8091242.1 heme oxygenase-domain-containing protein [Gilbertella persicaria]